MSPWEQRSPTNNGQGINIIVYVLGSSHAHKCKSSWLIYFLLGYDHIFVCLDHIFVCLDHICVCLDHIFVCVDYIFVYLDHILVSVDYILVSVDYILVSVNYALIHTCSVRCSKLNCLLASHTPR